MNDESNLDLYSRLLLFKNDHFQDEILWQNPDTPLQRVFQSLAHKLDLEYEYSLQTRVVRISRTIVPEMQMDLGTRQFEFFDLQNPENGHNLPTVDLSMLNSPFYDTNLSTSFSQPGPLTGTPVTVSESPMLLSDSTNWSNLASDDFLQDMDDAILSADYENSLCGQWSSPQTPVSPAIEVYQSSFRPPPNHHSILNFPSDECEPQNGAQRILDSPAKPLDSVLSTPMADTDQADSDMDTDGSEASAKRSQRFFCTDYPPCPISFTRSKHLARHMR